MTHDMTIDSGLCRIGGTFGEAHEKRQLEERQAWVEDGSCTALHCTALHSLRTNPLMARI